MQWNQREGSSVATYAKFIRSQYVCKHNRNSLWSRKFGSFNPDSKEDWFKAGLLEDVSDEMQRIMHCRDLCNEDLSLNQLVDVAQDAADLLMLYEKKNRCGTEINGYAYKLDDFSINEYGYAVVYTDGACPGNGTSNVRAGVGVWFGENHV